MGRKWNCVECGWTTCDNMTLVCGDCEGMVLVIPEKMDNALFIAIIQIVEEHYNLDTGLNHYEDGVDLFAGYGYDTKIATIRNWSEFQKFFGNYFYRQFQAVIEKSE